MARKKVETNISYDDARQVYYVCMDHGADENGRRVKCYRTYPTLAQARRGLREFSGGAGRPAAGLAPFHHTGPVAGVLDGAGDPAKPRTDHRLRLWKDHPQPSLARPGGRSAAKAHAPAPPGLLRNADGAEGALRQHRAPAITICSPARCIWPCGRTCCCAAPPTGWSRHG